MNKLHWIGFCFTMFGFIGILGCILITILGISCVAPSDYAKIWTDRIGDHFELVKLSDVKQLDGSFVFGTGDIKVDSKIIFAYKNKQGDIQIGSIAYDKIKIRYKNDVSPFILVEYVDNSYPSSDIKDFQDSLSRFNSPYIRYIVFCIPERGDKDFIKDWK